MESGSNFSKADDNDPYGSGASVQQIYNYAAANPTLTTQNLSGLLESEGLTWKSYTEGTQLYNTNGVNNTTTSGGTLTANAVPQSLWSVPLFSFSGNNASYVNPYNGSNQWNVAIKHTGQCFFTQTNGSTINIANLAPSNVEAFHYPPLAQLTNDLANNTYANYNVITPDQYNDMHTALSAGFTYNGTHYTGDLAQMAQGDNFCSIVVPQIKASAVYQAGHAAIVIWTDETEGANQNNFTHTLTEIVISPYAKGNAYKSTVNMTHSSDLATMQRIFGLTANTPSGYLNDAANLSNSSGALAGTGEGYGTAVGQDMSDLFVSGAFPSAIPGLNLSASGYALQPPQRRLLADGHGDQHADARRSPTRSISWSPTCRRTRRWSSPTGTSVNNQAGSPYVLVSQTGLAAGASATVPLTYSR